MEVLKELIENGKQLGFDEKELSEWVENQQKKFAEQEKLRAKLDKERFENEMRLNKEKMECELKLLEERAKLDDGKNKDIIAAQNCVNRTPASKLPAFVEKVDKFDSYLLRFERFAVQQQWPEEQWATYLGNCLKGTALEVYSRLYSEDAQDY